MNASFLLRTAAVLNLVFLAGHTWGIFAQRSRGPGERSLFEAMRAYRFLAMGSLRSHWDFYLGFSLFLSANLLVLTVLMWQLGSLARTDAARARPFMATLLGGYILFSALCWRYFFIAPAMTSTAISLFLALALFAARRATLRAGGLANDRP
jgi:hypothetical protein